MTLYLCSRLVLVLVTSILTPDTGAVRVAKGGKLKDGRLRGAARPIAIFGNVQVRW